MAILRIYDVTDWKTNNYTTHIAQYLKKYRLMATLDFFLFFIKVYLRASHLSSFCELATVISWLAISISIFTGIVTYIMDCLILLNCLINLSCFHLDR